MHRILRLPWAKALYGRNVCISARPSAGRSSPRAARAARSVSGVPPTTTAVIVVNSRPVPIWALPRPIWAATVLLTRLPLPLKAPSALPEPKMFCCEIEPLKRGSCDETKSIKAQIRRLKAMQDYVDVIVPRGTPSSAAACSVVCPSR